MKYLFLFIAKLVGVIALIAGLKTICSVLARRSGPTTRTALSVGSTIVSIAVGIWVGLAWARPIGSWLGAILFDLSGAAATSSGLAWLGGGSLVSGGSGMAGGTALIGATGGVAGAIASSRGIKGEKEKT